MATSGGLPACTRWSAGRQVSRPVNSICPPVSLPGRYHSLKTSSSVPPTPSTSMLPIAPPGEGETPGDVVPPGDTGGTTAPLGAPVSVGAGVPVGDPAGVPVGDPAGVPVGDPAGVPVGDPAGVPVGDPPGMPVGSPVAPGEVVGAVVVGSVVSAAGQATAAASIIISTTARINLPGETLIFSFFTS